MHRPPTILWCVLLLAAPRPSFAQCRVPPTDITTGAVGSGRAILSDYETGLQPHIHFCEKTPQGWQLGPAIVVGDQSVFYPVQVAIDGDRAIAGCAEAGGAYPISGRAFVFDRAGDQWIPTELVSASNGEGGFFGAAVDIDGDVAIVFAHHQPPAGDGLPRVHVFEFDGATWTETAQIPGAISSIAVDGDAIVIGNEGIHNGVVDLYRKSAGLWIWSQRIYSSPTPPPGGPRFGSSVAIEGDRLVAGGSGSSAADMPSFVDVFQRLGGGYYREQRLVPDETGIQDYFGTSVALAGPSLLVGAPGPGSPGGQGVVYRFHHDGTRFVESGFFGPDETTVWFGGRVSCYREDAVVATSYVNASFYRLGFANTNSFCPTTPNSTGSVATLVVEGCDSRAGERLTLAASGLPAGVLGQIILGQHTIQVPFGDGFRCVGDPFFRLPSATADAAGRLVHDLDFASAPGSMLTAGSTWHFQALHRDPGTAARLNLTNALSIGITP